MILLRKRDGEVGGYGGGDKFLGRTGKSLAFCARHTLSHLCRLSLTSIAEHSVALAHRRLVEVQVEVDVGWGWRWW